MDDASDLVSLVQTGRPPPAREEAALWQWFASLVDAPRPSPARPVAQVLEVELDLSAVRTTPDGRRLSVYDALQVAGLVNPWQAWVRLRRKHPMLLRWITYHRFKCHPPTPMAELSTIRTIVRLLPKKRHPLPDAVDTPCMDPDPMDARIPIYHDQSPNNDQRVSKGDT